MKKKNFIAAINALEKQYQADEQFAKNLGKCFPSAFEANLLPDNHLLTNALVEILQSEMEDIDNWIEYFCYEKDFGKRKDLQAFNPDGSKIKLTTASDLYKLLTQKT